MKKFAIGFAVVLALLLILGIAGQYAGSYVFVQLAKLPEDVWGLTTLFQYHQAYGNHPAVMKLLKIGFAVSIAVPALPTLIILAAVIFGRQKRELHGSQRFALSGEIARAGLLSLKKKETAQTEFPSQPELLIGKYKGKFLRWRGNEFGFIAAPTRSGKGVGIVIPNCLNYSDSMVIFDPKLENFIKTSGHRNKLGQEVFLFNPAGRMEEEARADQPLFTHRWNSFSYVSRDPRFTYSDISNMAQVLYPKSAKDDGNASFWTESAQKLFVGLALYMVETEQERLQKDAAAVSSLSLLFRMTAPVGYSLADWVKYFVLGMDEPQGQGVPPKKHTPANVSDTCKTLLSGFATGNAKTGADIVATLTAPLTVFLDPVVAAATSADDFDLRDVRKKRMTVYIGIQPNDIDRLGRLTNLFFSQLINENIKQGLPENNPALKYQCLLLIDEFTALGYMPVLEKGVAYIAGYNLRMLIIFQSPSQVARLYTKEGSHTFFSNFAAQVIFSPRHQTDATEYSELIGYETFKAKSTGRSSGKGTSRSQNVSDQKRALMLPDELKVMPMNECIISMNGMRPIHAEKIFYYKEKDLAPLVKIPPVSPPQLHLGQSLTAPAKVSIKTDTPECCTTDELEAGGILASDPSIYNREAMMETIITGVIDDDDTLTTPDALSDLKQALQEIMGDAGLRLLHQVAAV